MTEKRHLMHYAFKGITEPDVMHFIIIVTPLPVYCSSAPQAPDLCAKLLGMCPTAQLAPIFPPRGIYSHSARQRREQRRANRSERATLNSKFPIMHEWLFPTLRLVANGLTERDSKLPPGIGSSSILHSRPIPY